MEILKSLKYSDVIRDFTILEYRTFKLGFYIKVRADLINSSTLIITEYSDEEERNYSYQWQSLDDKTIERWDNAPHHKNISTYPHHRHKDDKVLPSEEITLEDILKHIRQILK